MAGKGGKGMTNFPPWLGKNSTKRKNTRLFREMKVHMSRVASGDFLAVQLDYSPVLRYQLMNLLATQGKDGVQDVVHILDEYGLDLENFETLQATPFSLVAQEKIDTQVKTLLTKTFKQTHEIAAKKKKGKEESNEVAYEEENDDVLALGAESEEEEEQPATTKDDIVKPKKVRMKSGAGGKASRPTSTAGKASAAKKTGTAVSRKRKST
jgi:hypothetical protein